MNLSLALRRSLVLSLCLVVFSPVLAHAEEKFEDLLKRAQELKDQGKFSAAMTELSWATKQLEKSYLGQLEAVFPKSSGDLTGGEFNSGSALGLINIERTYSNAAGASVKATLTGAAASEGSAQQGMGMLTGLAGMAAFMGNTPGSDTVRIKGNRGVIQNENDRPQLTVPLNGGMMIQLESQGGGKVTKDQLVSLAESFNYDSLAGLAGGK